MSQTLQDKVDNLERQVEDLQRYNSQLEWTLETMIEIFKESIAKVERIAENVDTYEED